jgi:DNA-binding CsgD family transcriptional regulator
MEYERSLDKLVAAVQELSLARTLDAVTEVVRRTARRLAGADGASFVLKDGDECHYADEDAIAPLWKGRRFPMHLCISGWVMLNRCPAVIPDIYADARIPVDAYRPTFVRSMVIVPIRTMAPVGAIGTYWAEHRQPSPWEVKALQALADSTAVALENVYLCEQLEGQAKARDQELKPVHGTADPLDKLTARERAVLHWTAQGLSGARVARRLQVSPRTVETHRANLMRKLGLKNQRELVRYALERGLVPRRPGAQ